MKRLPHCPKLLNLQSPLAFTTMSESIFKTAVAEIVLRHGVAVTDDPVRLHNLLRDYCSSEKCRREINLTMMCAKNGLMALLRETDARTPLAAHLNRVVCILHEEHGIEQSFAQNVVGIWSELFGDHRKLLEQLYACNFSLKQIEDPAVQNKLGDCLYNGRGVAQDYAEAVKWYRKAAEQGDAGGASGLGVCYCTGHGAAQDHAEGFKWFRKAAEQGDARGANGLGVCYYNGQGVAQDDAEGVKWFRKAAEQGYAAAQQNLGNCYHNGRGVAQDDAEAVRWYRKAAEQGNVSAQKCLGYWYSEGRGVGKDEVEAVRWYRKAAEQGDDSAQFSLGCKYCIGEGVPRDDTEAAKWFRKAAEQGHIFAQEGLGDWYYLGVRVNKDDAEAVRWYRKAAEQGSIFAQHKLGDMYSEGRGVDKDDVEAVRWYRKAAEKGWRWAQDELGRMYSEGRGVGKDDVEAVRWYRKAAEQGNAEAQCRLGFCYERGAGVVQDDAEAVKWFRKAAEKGDAAAQDELKRYSEREVVLVRDQTEAAKEGNKAGEVQTMDLGGGVKLDLVWCSPGSFTMGSPEDEKGLNEDETQHRVTLTKGFWMGRTPVTQAQYQKLTGKAPSYFKGDDLPVEKVSWDDAVAFCVELTRRERAVGQLPHGYVYRLPTEAEWEYAAKGGSKSKGFTYSGGNDLDSVGWHRGNSGRKTHPVAQKTPNELDLCDMSGNVWEWCQDWHATYPASNESDPKGASSGSFRVYRGGSWNLDASFCRSSCRNRSWPSFANYGLGFRVVLAVSEDKPTQTVISESVQVAGSPKAKPTQSIIGEPEPGARSPMPGKPWTTPDLGMVLMPVAAGSFRMGSENGREDMKPVRTVRITRDFWMGRTPVTQAQYQKLTGKAPSYFKGDDLPVEKVSWDDAVAFCDELTRREHTAGRLPQGYVYRLPTEAEWEYAAQGGSKGKGFTYSGGNDIDAVGWYGGNSGGTTHPVGQKEPNELGLYDMSGNVWEWCQDWHAAYPASNESDPKGASSGSSRVDRGGGWRGDASCCRSANRFRCRPSYAYDNLGFRVVLAPVP